MHEAAVKGPSCSVMLLANATVVLQSTNAAIPINVAWFSCKFYLSFGLAVYFGMQPNVKAVSVPEGQSNQAYCYPNISRPILSLVVAHFELEVLFG